MSKIPLEFAFFWLQLYHMILHTVIINQLEIADLGVDDHYFSRFCNYYLNFPLDLFQARHVNNRLGSSIV